MKYKIETLLRELKRKERSNRADVKDAHWGGAYVQGFADAQAWMARELRKILNSLK